YTNAQMEKLKPQVEQLRREAQVQPMKVSAASSNLIAFMATNLPQDPLVPNNGPIQDNPFEEKKKCSVL
ncbi:hypothetical protein PMAYCL1PPCAC_01002, partial [Pristionchus mayeri]